MAYGFHGKQSGLEMKDVLDERFQAFVKTIERGVPKFGDSTGTFMKDMILYGPSKYDVVITYENLAIQSIPAAQGRWGNLRVVYPKPTMWSSHPLAIVQADWVSREQQAAARQLVSFLRSRATQQKALRHGFRPADPTIPIIDSAADNPFNGAKAYGVQVKVPAVVEAPAGPIIQNILEMWNRTIGRR
jgi:ABC-type sulfate transport system substrate-binding protein